MRSLLPRLMSWSAYCYDLDHFQWGRHGAHELASEPYVQSCSETEQDVHGLLPSHLTVEHDQYPVIRTPLQTRQVTSGRAC